MITRWLRRLIGAVGAVALLGALVYAYPVASLGDQAAGVGGLSAMYLDIEDAGSAYWEDGPYRFEAWIGGEPTSVSVQAWTTGPQPEIGYYMRFTAPKGEELAVGTYDGATNSTDGGLPRLSTSAPCMTSVGRFTIHELESRDGEVLRFAASFEKHCGSLLTEFGEVRYRSAVPLAALVLSPPSSNFGAPGQTRSFTLANRGSSTQQVTVALHGQNPDDFRIAATTCAQIAPGESCMIEVAFETAEASQRQALLVVDDQTLQATRSAHLVGQGLAPASVDLHVTQLPGGSRFALAATVNATAGTVTFLDQGGNMVASAPIGSDGTASAEVALAPGSHWLIASASGSGYGRGESLPVPVTVSP